MSKLNLRPVQSGNMWIFEVFHPLQPNEMAANKSYLLSNPTTLVLPWTVRWPVQPPTALYPEALVRDARLAKHHKGRGELLLTDNDFFTRIWRHDARARDVEHYVKRWHKENDDERVADDHKRVADEDRIRAKFHKDVYEIMHAREKAHLKVARLQEALFKAARAHRGEMHRKEAAEVVHLIKEGFKRHARFLEWRLDNMFLPTDTHSFVRVKHHGEMIEHVLGSLLWQARHAATLRHQEWRHADNFVPLPSGGMARVHGVPGKSQQETVEHLQIPVLQRRTKSFRHWHKTGLEILTPNHNIVHAEEGAGMLPETVAARIWQPKLEETRRVTAQWHRSHQEVTLPNGSFTSAKNGDGKMPEAVTAALDTIKKHKVTAAHQAFRADHMFVKTSNGTIATQKKHGHSLETVGAQVGEVPRRHSVAATKDWRESHQFRESANHIVASVRRGGQSLERVSGAHYGHIRDKITRRFEERAANNLYMATGNGAIRRLRGDGHSMIFARTQVSVPVEGMVGEPLPHKGGHVFQSAKTAQAGRALAEHKHKLRQVLKAMAAHDQTVSLLQGHVVVMDSNAWGVTSDAATAVLNTSDKKERS